MTNTRGQTVIRGRGIKEKNVWHTEGCCGWILTTCAMPGLKAKTNEKCLNPTWRKLVLTRKRFASDNCISSTGLCYQPNFSFMAVDAFTSLPCELFDVSNPILEATLISVLHLGLWAHASPSTTPRLL